MPSSYLGMSFSRDYSGITASMTEYLRKLSFIEITEIASSKKTTWTTQTEKNQMRKVLGQLQWLAVQAMSEIAFSVARFLGLIPKSTLGDMISLNKLIRHVIFSEKAEIYYRNLGPSENWELLSFSDASWANSECGGTKGGHCLSNQCGQSQIMLF